jgi:hypothetical protein
MILFDQPRNGNAPDLLAAALDANREGVAGDGFWISAKALAAELVCGIIEPPRPIHSVTVVSARSSRILSSAGLILSSRPLQLRLVSAGGL